MSDNLAPSKLPIAEQLRAIAGRIRQENAIQANATARILGAAAAIAHNQDALIDEVAEMVNEDLDTQAQAQALSENLYTVEQLKQQFKTLGAAKDHFNLKARSWDALVAKLNEAGTSPPASPQPSQGDVEQRLAAIEGQLNSLSADMNQVLHLVAGLYELLNPEQ